MDTTQFPTQPELGDLLSDYKLVRKLAATSMSVVYQARELALDRDVALKVLHPTIAGTDDFQRRFEREVSIAAGLVHPNVIQIHAKGERDGVCYVAMQYVDGPDLARLVRERGRLDLPTTVRIVQQVAAALGEAHRQGLVHRDVKPSNVLVDLRTWHAYLCDFGIAKQVAAQGLTLPGEFLGSTPYVAPEQIRGDGLSPAADQYALGCAVYECLTGAPPFPPTDAASVLWAHMNQPPPRLADHVPPLGLPPAVDDVIAKAMAKDAGERYESCDAFATALAAAAAGATSGTPAPPPQAPPPPPREHLIDLASPPAPGRSLPRPGRRLRAVAIAAAVVVLAAVLFAVVDIPWPPSVDPHAGASDVGGDRPAASSAPAPSPSTSTSPSTPGSPTAGPSTAGSGQTPRPEPSARPGNNRPSVAPTGPPQMRFLSPAAGATVSGVITMRVYVSNPAWLVQVEFQYLTHRCGGDDTYKKYIRSDKAPNADGVYEMAFDTRLAENGCLHLLAVGRGHDGELYPRADEGVYLRVQVRN